MILWKKIQIRNSTVDFLIFTKQNGEDGIEVRVHDEDVWLTQKSMAQLFGYSTDNISLHMKNIFASGELSAEAVTEKSSATASDGKKYMMKFYNLDVIISVGYRMNSIRATQFRQWTIRLWQLLQKFFAMVHNKLHYAIHQHTAAEVIVECADHRKEHMGLTSWKNASMGKIVKADVRIAKNYLTSEESQDLNQFVTMYLDYAERQARRKIPMTMEDWAKRLDIFLEFNEEEILRNKGKVSAEIAKSFAESEFEKYRIIQDRLYQSDFDKLLLGIDNGE